MATKPPQSAAERRLAALAAYGILDTPPEDGFDDIVLVASHACSTPVALVSLVALDRQWFKARVGFEGCQTPIEQPVCAHALDGTDLLVIPDLSIDPRTRDNTLVTRTPAIRFYAGAPLVTPEGVVVGTLCVIDTKARPEGLSPAQARVLEALARQVVNQLELRREALERDAKLEATMRAGIASLALAVATSEEENASLRDSDLRARSAQEAGGVGLMEVDVASGQVLVSPEFCRVFGLPIAPSYTAEAIEALVLPEDAAMRSSAASRAEGSATIDVEYRIRRPDDARVRWIARRAQFVRDAAGRVVTMIGTVQDVSDRKRLESHQAALLELGDRLGEIEEHEAIVALAAAILGRTLSGSAAGYGTVSRDGAVLTVSGDWTGPDAPRIGGARPIADGSAFFEELRAGRDVIVADSEADPLTMERVEAFRQAGARAFLAHPMMERGRWVALMYVNDRVPRTWSADEIAFARALAGRTKAALDHRRVEAEQQVLNQELSHRLKNTLAMVQAIATQTLRAVPDREPVLAFEKRLHALATAHDVLLQESWHAASMRAIVTAVLGTFGQADRIEVSGPDLALGPRATMSLSLLLHELATNALKYGALSVEAGRVAVAWRQEGEGEEACMILVWEESSGPPVKEPDRKGFGSRLIGMGLVGTGGVTLRYPVSGFRAEMSAPLVQLRQS